MICLNGDGSMLMSLGTLVTVVASGVENLALVVMENGTYEITGNQSIPGGSAIDFVAMARAAGFRHAFRIDAADTLERGITDLLQADGPVFCAVQVGPGNEGPISRSADEEARYLKNSLAESARRQPEMSSPSPPSPERHVRQTQGSARHRRRQESSVLHLENDRGRCTPQERANEIQPHVAK